LVTIIKNLRIVCAITAVDLPDGQSTNQDDITIPLDLAGCMINFRHRLPTKEEFSSLKQLCLTQGDNPWDPSSFSDQVADKFHKQVLNPTMPIV
jgi:hypothetical protein